MPSLLRMITDYASAVVWGGGLILFFWVGGWLFKGWGPAAALVLNIHKYNDNNKYTFGNNALPTTHKKRI